ncbi:MAG: helix-turn-helix domain-containing protein [Bryobacteraceae bacterium]
MQPALDRIAALAPTLKEAELRTILELTRRAGDGSECRCSSRELARAAQLSRNHVQAAIDSLTERGLIESDGGSATRASSYHLAFLETAVLV